MATKNQRPRSPEKRDEAASAAAPAANAALSPVETAAAAHPLDAPASRGPEADQPPAATPRPVVLIPDESVFFDLFG